MKTITLECSSCGKSFERVLKEYKRTNVKGGRKPYCSLECSGNANHEHLKATQWTSENAPRGNRWEKDEYSPFREYMRRIRNRKRDRDKEVDVDKEYLKEVFEQQKSICIYSGAALEHCDYSSKGKSNPLTTASVDRIDSSKGYVKGNIQFTSIVCNHAKNGMSDTEMKEWIKLVRSDKNKD
tara:strand:+ start:2431 stop:2976 length:546 start_codon:yes stop_codon:yes gene_type:complete